MTFDEWLKTVPREFTDDPLWCMEVYRLAFLASDLSWPDVTKLMKDPRTIALSDQLYRAVGSIKANISEGYSHRSGKDQARFYEYSLGSAREARGWYRDGRHVLGENITNHRIQLMTKIARLLLTIIPSERGYKLKEEQEDYLIDDQFLFGELPFP
ncbi:MAG: four helix bundle protein [Chloroflexi bacterium]|nr:four helix bundle protein [Chloroflexota bacterium]